eukprot:CAMPEP_0182432698 /NCGR_PEP_ID=MMETSP1167-20130531/58299_1 /TAXON_ID=2988 /ORGANISM="Mallomonas Sp, Strain CCMP3275" /LENGTH=383 /DNA_ID=CAMNT_0024620525 /DNA_START=62 /DNA_END=1210 /DNA_ORIENTATION=-
MKKTVNKEQLKFGSKSSPIKSYCTRKNQPSKNLWGHDSEESLADIAKREEQRLKEEAEAALSDQNELVLREVTASTKKILNDYTRQISSPGVVVSSLPSVQSSHSSSPIKAPSPFLTLPSGLQVANPALPPKLTLAEKIKLSLSPSPSPIKHIEKGNPDNQENILDTPLSLPLSHMNNSQSEKGTDSPSRVTGKARIHQDDTHSLTSYAFPLPSLTSTLDSEREKEKGREKEGMLLQHAYICSRRGSTNMADREDIRVKGKDNMQNENALASGSGKFSVSIIEKERKKEAEEIDDHESTTHSLSISTSSSVSAGHSLADHRDESAIHDLQSQSHTSAFTDNISVGDVEGFCSPPPVPMPSRPSPLNPSSGPHTSPLSSSGHTV